MILADGQGCMVQCDGCGAVGEAVETRNLRTGALTAAFLPKGWKFDVVDGEHIHRCGECFAAAVEPFADRRAAFEARLDHLGTALTVDIAVSLGVPIALGRRWAGEWKSRQFGGAAAGHQVIGGEQDAAAGLGAVAQMLPAGGDLDERAVMAARRCGRTAGLAREGGAGVVGQLDMGEHRDAKGVRGRWHAASMRDRAGLSNRGKA